MKVLIVIGHVVTVAAFQHRRRKRTNASKRHEILSERLKSSLRIDRIGTEHGIRRDRLEYRVRSEHQSVARSNEADRTRRMPRGVDYSQALVFEENFVVVLQRLDVIQWISKALELLIAR